MTNRYEKMAYDLGAQMKIWEEPVIIAQASHAAIRLWTAALNKDTEMTTEEATDAFCTIRRLLLRVKYLFEIANDYFLKGVDK